MNIRIDTEARAIYLEFRHDRVSRTIEFAQEAFVDLDSRGRPLGIELLNPGILDVQLRRIGRRYHIPDNLHIRSELKKARELIPS